jgi:hypothetical protein
MFVPAPPRPVAPAPEPPSRVALVDPAGPAPAGPAPTGPAPTVRATLAMPQAAAASAASQAVPLEDTVLRPDVFGDAPPDEAEPAHRPRRLVAGIVAGVVVLALAAGGTYLLTRPGSPTAQQTHATGDQGAGGQGGDGGDGPSDNIGGIVPPVEHLDATVDKAAHKATFSWKLPHRQDGDTFGWGVIDPLKGDPSLTQTSETSVTVPLGADGDVCVVVVVDREGRQSAVPQRKCALKQ